MRESLQPSTLAPADQLLHDMRATHDAANLHLESIRLSGEGAWIIMRITPALHSGSATVIGAALDADSGQFIDRSTGSILSSDEMRSGIIMEGIWELLDAISGPPPAGRGNYSWTEPPRTHLHGITAEDLYEPFARGGVVLCQFLPRRQGREQFNSVHLLPSGWEADLRSAYQAFRQNSKLFSDANLVRLIQGDNPVLAVIAFRTLAENGKVDASLLRSVLARAQGPRQAALIYLTMSHPPGLSNEALLGQLTQAGERASQLPESRAFGLGIATAWLLHPGLHSSQSLGPHLLLDHRRRTTPKSDPYLARLFDMVGVSDA